MKKLLRFWVALCLSFPFVAQGQNLIVNGGAENGVVGWTTVSGAWVRYEWVTPQEGSYHFYAGQNGVAEMYQDVDVSAYATGIDAGTEQFTFTGYVRNYGAGDLSRIIVEYRDALGNVLSTYDSGNQDSRGVWTQLTDSRPAPANTRIIRVRLVSTRIHCCDNDGYYDALSLTRSTVLPVELTQFTGQNTERGNLLKWTTASEENNAGFEIQKSNNGRDFGAIGYVAGNGTTFQLQRYTFLDEDVSTGIAYYRLKQLDTNGEYEYSEIISLQAKTWGNQVVSIYPNPVSHTLYLEEGQGMASLFNALGQCVLQVRIVDARHALNLEELRRGVYTLHLQLEKGGVFTQQVVK